MKRFFAIILVLLMACNMSVAAFASEFQTYSAMVAIANDINEKGTNLTNDTNSDDNITQQKLNIRIAQISQSELQVLMPLGNEFVSVVGTPIARSENGEAVFFSATSSCADYSVVNMAYVNSTNTSMFFKTHCNSTASDGILKVYLKDLTSQTRDYILVECFEYIIPNFDAYIMDLPVDALAGSWYSREFKSISFGEVEPGISPAYASPKTKTFESTFWNLGAIETNTITLKSTVTYSDIHKNGEESFTYSLKVTGKSITCPDDPSVNSSTQSALYVTGLTLRQATSPNTAFTSEHIDGEVSRNGIGFGDLSASIGIGKGPFGVSLSIPLTGYTSCGTIDIDENWKFFDNDINTNDLKRTNKTTMSSDFMLADIDDRFVVSCMVMDFGGVERATQLHKGIWDIEIENRGAFEYTDETFSHEVYHNIIK